MTRLNGVPIEEVLPELRESEDERIRRWLCDYFSSIDKAWIHKDITCIDILRWLEKHKDQKPAEPSGKLSRQDYLYQLLIDQLITYSDYEYLIEHKPAELKEDTQLLAGDYAISHYEQGKTYSSSEVHKMLADAFIAGKSYQKHAEWSEEDESELTAVIYCVSRAIKASKDENERNSLLSAKKWLQDKLSFRVKSLCPQPIQLKEAYKDGFQTARQATASTFMTYLDENRPEGKMCLSNSECEDIDKAFKEGDWAKIMRYYEKYRSSWKPSEH